MVWEPPGAIGWKLAHCPPSSKWVPGGNTGDIKVGGGKDLVNLPHNTDGPGQVSSLTGTPQPTDHIWDLPLPTPLKYICYMP